MTYNTSQGGAISLPLKERVASATATVKEWQSTEAQANGRRHRWLQVLLWVIFGTGLLVQVFGPRLRITNHACVIPHSLIAEGKDMHPDEIIAEERRRHVLSAILSVGSALVWLSIIAQVS
jgi:hypothetical protein